MSLPLYNHKRFDLGHTQIVSGFPYFLQFKTEFGNKNFMVCATVSFQSCFWWLCRTSPSSAAENIIKLILSLTIWWCPCIESSLVLLEEVFAMTSAFSWQNSISLCLASFSIPHSICQQICKTQQWPQDWKRSVFIPIPKKHNAKECSDYHKMGENISRSPIWHRLISRIYIEFLKFNNSIKTNNWINNGQGTWIDISPQKVNKYPKSMWKDSQHH